MQDFRFTGLWPQEGNPLVWFEHRGTTPIDALLRTWASCLPTTRMSSPLRCEQDGHIYHLDLTETGERRITVAAAAEQTGRVKTLERLA